MDFSCKRGGAVVVALLLAVALAPAAFAQSTEERERDLERQVEQLKAEVDVVQSGGGSTEAERIAELERRLEVLAGEIEKLKIGEAAVAADESEHGFGPAASKIYRTERGLSIGGYGEVIYQQIDEEKGEDEEVT